METDGFRWFAGFFSKKGERKQKETNELIDSLYKQVGQLTVELDWLKKSPLAIWDFL